MRNGGRLFATYRRTVPSYRWTPAALGRDPLEVASRHICNHTGMSDVSLLPTGSALTP